MVLEAQFQAVGLNVRVRTLESAALQTTLGRCGEFAFFLSGLSPRPDAEIYYCQFWESTSSSTGVQECRVRPAVQRGAGRPSRTRIARRSSRTWRPCSAPTCPGFRSCYLAQVEGWRSSRPGGGSTGRRGTPGPGT
ncbi:MAG: hypothetical protein MZV64_70915 [Ignavibacteriales bacterium]|nr:hypothetical protein [Ignavibacteriales bacterium]